MKNINSSKAKNAANGDDAVQSVYVVQNLPFFLFGLKKEEVNHIFSRNATNNSPVPHLFLQGK